MDNALIVDCVSKVYPGRVAVDNISFAVQKGSIHGFLGPNGAGKSTTMKMISGLIPKNSGSIKLFNKEVSMDDFELKNQIGLLPENPPLYLDMTVKNYLNFVGKIHNVENLNDRYHEVIKSLHLENVENRIIGNLSKGYKQRVGLGQAIFYDAPFLILDEPTNGLDPQSVVELREFIKKLATNKTILFSSHILSEVENLCSDITIIHQGKIKASGKMSEMRRIFKQGFSVELGVLKHTKLPKLIGFGDYEVVNKQTNSEVEDRMVIKFQNEADQRAKLIKFLVNQNIDLLSVSSVNPILEDIFLSVTESKNDL